MTAANDDPMAVCEAVLDLVGDKAECLATVTTGSTALTRFANSRIHQNVAEDALNVYVKAIVDGRSASATTTQVDKDGLQKLVDRVLAAAPLRPPDPDWPGLAPAAEALAVEHWDDATAAADPVARAAVVKDFVDAGGGLEGAGFCSTSGTQAALANSAGARHQGRWTRATIDGIQRTGTSDASASFTSARVADLDGGAVGGEAAQRSRAAIEAVDIEPGHYEVVLRPSCLANMLQFLVYGGFTGRPHADGTSYVHLGDQQFDATVNIWDDAADSRAIGPLYDGEGTPKRRLDLVSAGVSQSLAHDRRSAGKVGAESTGGAPANLFFGEARQSHDELIAGVDRGLLVCDFWYTRILDPKTQVVTGLTRNGVFLIEGGQVGPAVKNMRFTQSFVATLAPGKVLAIGNDARLVGAMHVPSVRLASWNFTGGAKG